MRQVKGLVLQVESQLINIHKGYKFALLLLMILLICHKCLHILIRCIFIPRFEASGYKLEETRWATSTRHINLAGQTDDYILHLRHHTLYWSTGNDHKSQSQNDQRGEVFLESADPTRADQTRADSIWWDYVLLHFLSLFPLSTVSSR